MSQDTYQPWWADPSIGMKDKWWEDTPSEMEDMIAAAVADMHQQLEKFAYFPEDDPFEEEIENPEEDVLDIADHASLLEVSASTLLESGQNHDDEANKNLDMAQGQVEIVSLKIDDIQLDNNHSIVVGKEGSVCTIVELDVVWESWYHDPSGRWWDNQWLDHVTTTWVAVGKLPRPEIIPIEGSAWLQMPFDPGKFQHFLHQFNFCCCLV